MNNLSFTPHAWEDYIFWQSQDKKTLKRINSLFEDIARHPLSGIGKPEKLKEGAANLWSRRIDDANRLVYRPGDSGVEIIQCRGHYGDK